MKLIELAFLLYTLQCFVECTPADGTVDVFQFGENVGFLSFSKSGNIGLHDKHVEVPIVLPQCMEISYLRVDVDNRRGPPKVDFDADINTVFIKYRRGQFSKSSYTVTAKAVPSPYCSKK